ncbi:MAG: hypothetical protein WA118_11135 [Carboxydocellales bacterium]
MNKKILLSISFIALISAIGLWGFSGQNITKSKPVSYGSASWVRNYADINELFDGADVIVEGKAKSIKSYMIQNSPNTDVSFSVKKWHKGSDNKSRNEITVIQDGGEINGVIYKLDQVETMESGKEYILFLKYDSNTDHYYVLTGWQGLYKLGLFNAENSDSNRTMPKDKLLKTLSEKSLKTK